MSMSVTVQCPACGQDVVVTYSEVSPEGLLTSELDLGQMVMTLRPSFEHTCPEVKE